MGMIRRGWLTVRTVIVKGMEQVHIPILKTEVVKFLAVKPDKKYIDTTVGGGGHAEAILKSGGEILGIDFDSAALAIAQRHLASACPADVGRWRLHHGNFANLKEIVQQHNFFPVAGIIFDLGVSSFQLEDESRGFSFKSEALLDMRMDPASQGITAKDLVNGLNEGELYALFTKLGEEHYSRRLAHAICRARRRKSIENGLGLAQIVLEALPVRKRYGRIHPATNVFRALRMAVNDELNNLKEALPQAAEILDKDGRLVVLSFHSLEDRIVKHFLAQKEEEGILRILTKKPIMAAREEVEKNPRARSVKLRAAEKI